MYIQVDPKSGVPLYTQIKDEIRLAVATGALGPGDQLPGVRNLATQLRVNFNTVGRAYRELQAEGLLNSRRGSGTFVSAEGKKIGQREAEQIIERMLRHAANRVLNANVDSAVALTMFTQALMEGLVARDKPKEVNHSGGTSD